MVTLLDSLHCVYGTIKLRIYSKDDVSGSMKLKPLTGGPVYFVIATRANRYYQYFDYICMNAVDYTHVPGPDAAAARKFSGKRLAGFIRLTSANTGFNCFENSPCLVLSQIFQIVSNLMVVNHLPGHASSSSANLLSISS